MGELTRAERSAMAKRGQGNRSPSSRSQSAHKANRKRSPVGRTAASKKAVSVMLKTRTFPSRNLRKRRR